VGGQWVSGPNNVHMLNKCKNDKIKVRKKKKKSNSADYILGHL
jgi:hypothetical protein